MKILGIDTTTKFLCLGLSDGAKIYEYNLELGRKMAGLLIPTIKRALDALGWRIEDIDYFACGLGPGSFTGIRVGLSAIKGLSWPLKKPIIAIPSLDILAKNVNPPPARNGGVKQDNAYVVPIIDAKRNLIYSSIYKTKDGTLKRIAPYMLLTQAQLFQKIKPSSFIFGDAVLLYKENILKNVRRAILLDTDYWYPKAHNIIALAKERIGKKNFTDAFSLKPIYLYPKECQIKSHRLK